MTLQLYSDLYPQTSVGAEIKVVVEWDNYDRNTQTNKQHPHISNM